MTTARGWGAAHAAVGLVNAIATGGVGAAAALGLWTRVVVEPAAGYRGLSHTRGETLEIDPVLLRAVDEAAAQWLGAPPLRGLRAWAWSGIPLEAGLKGSSALVNALLEAVFRLRGYEPPGLPGLARLGVEAARAAGLTVTGALDDHLSVSGCGAYVTRNPDALLLALPGIAGAGYAVVAPRGRLSIARVSRTVYASARREALLAAELAARGRLAEAALVNAAALASSHGWSLDPLLRAARLPGVAAVGVSGKGPSMYVLAVDEASAARAAALLSRATGSEALVAPLLACTQPLKRGPGSAGEPP